MIDTMKNIHHIELYLMSKGISFLFCTNTAEIYSTPDIKWKIDTPIISSKKFIIDWANDNIHVGPNTHKQLANHLLNLIKEKYDTTH
jgi:hypothetical protein